MCQMQRLQVHRRVLRLRQTPQNCWAGKAVSVKAVRGVRLAFAHPLFVSLGQVPDVEPGKSAGVTGSGISSPRVKPDQQRFRYLR